MAGRGPRPKERDQRARRNADPIDQTKLRLTVAAQPELPAAPAWLEDGWPEQTRRWWSTWGVAAQAEMFTATDWEFLLDTALIHALVWAGEVKHLAELRLRVAKFGATAEDRARLRMVVAGDDEGQGGQQRPAARERYGNLRAVSSAVAGS